MSIGPNYKFTNPFSENSQKEENGYSLFHDLIYNFACRINKDVKKNIILAKSFGESMDQLIFKENDIDRKPEDCNIVREPILNDNLKADIFFGITGITDYKIEINDINYDDEVKFILDSLVLTTQKIVLGFCLQRKFNFM